MEKKGEDNTLKRYGRQKIRLLGKCKWRGGKPDLYTGQAEELFPIWLPKTFLKQRSKFFQNAQGNTLQWDWIHYTETLNRRISTFLSTRTLVTNTQIPSSLTDPGEVSWNVNVFRTLQTSNSFSPYAHHVMLTIWEKAVRKHYFTHTKIFILLILF